jgi:poly(hydroxyalkanoate) depolymerase family esterase
MTSVRRHLTLVAAAAAVSCLLVGGVSPARAAGPVAPHAKSALVTGNLPCTFPDLSGTAWNADPAGTHALCTYSTQGLTRSYWVYAPPYYTGTEAQPWPLVVVLHGCTQQGPDVAYISQFDAEPAGSEVTDAEAAAEHFLIVYPNQAAYTMTGPTTFDGNGSFCWDWFLPQGQNRGAGEPALIAGITRSVISNMNVDRSRVDVIGVSAGGATADIMAATYPDIYAAAGIVAGCEYKGLPCLSSPSAVPPQVSGQEAYQASTDAGGSHARVVPFIVENGDADTVVPVANAFEVVQQSQIANDYAEHGGVLQNTVPSQFCSDTQVVPNPAVDNSVSPPVVFNVYDVYTYTLDGSPCAGTATGQLWIVHGEEHAWPGGPNLNGTQSSAQIYTNPGGPDFTDAAYQFFLANPCRLAGDACAPAVMPAANTPETALAAPLLVAGMLGAYVWSRNQGRRLRGRCRSRSS